MTNKNPLQILKEIVQHKAAGTLTLTIAPELQHYPKIRLSDVNELQGNLKDLSRGNMDKLLISLHTEGFYVPLFVWIDSKGKRWLLDGHQRYRTITTEYGTDIELPYTEVAAKSRSHAKKLLLAISSNYGKTTLEGLDEFKVDMDIFDIENVNFATTFGEDWGKPFDFGTEDMSEADNTKYSDKNKEIDTNDFSDSMDLIFKLSSNEYATINTKLIDFAEALNLGSKELVLKHIIKNAQISL